VKERNGSEKPSWPGLSIFTSLAQRPLMNVLFENAPLQRRCFPLQVANNGLIIIIPGYRPFDRLSVY
jgi:hypothetical protein